MYVRPGLPFFHCVGLQTAGISLPRQPTFEPGRHFSGPGFFHRQLGVLLL